MTKPTVNPRMRDAGIAALLELVPAEVLEETGIDPAQLVEKVYAAMLPWQWEPIRSASRSTDKNVMLGHFGKRGFEVGIGRYVNENDDTASGQWSTESWWGTPPSHWMPMPPQPPEAE